MDDGYQIGFTDEIIIKPKPDISMEQQMALHRQYSTTIIKTYRLFQVLRIPKGDNALEIANHYFETGFFIYSYPKITSKVEVLQDLPNDPYFYKQVALRNVGQTFLPDNHSGTLDADIDAPEAWEITKGCSDIVIAVIDQGVTPDHDDLPASRQKVYAGSNFGDGDADEPYPNGDNTHGNACAGVIAATMNNSRGIAGIAPNCKIMPIRVSENDGDLIPMDEIAPAVTFAVDSGAKVINLSIGANTWMHNFSPAMVNALEDATEENGCIVCAAAGNNALNDHDDPGFVVFPANVDVDGVITVGSSDRNDYQANYSPTDSEIDIVAPSCRDIVAEDRSSIPGEKWEMWSIDIPGYDGYNRWPSNMPHPPSTGETSPASGYNYLSYTSRFGGTSHSCAVVSGIVALMASLNPDLNSTDPEEVLDIFEVTAEKVRDQVYDYSYGGHCFEMGFGRVNAYLAILEVLGGPITSERLLLCQSPTTTFTYNNRPAGTTVMWTKSSNLQYVGGQGTNNYEVKAYSWASGTGWVKPCLNGSCDGLKFEVWVGPPAVEPDGPYEGSTWTYYVFDAYPSSPYYMYPTSWQWGVSPSYPYSYITPYGSTAGAWFYYEDYYQVYSKACNTCGWGDWGVHSIYISDEEMGFSMSPNPASDIITITMKKSSEIDAEIEDSYKEYTINIRDNYGVVYFSGIKTGESFTIPVNNLRDGSYFVQIIDGEKIYNSILIIKH